VRSLPGALLLLAACRSAPPGEDLEPLFARVETGTAAEALEASAELASKYDDAWVGRLGALLERAPLRGLPLLSELSSEGSARLLLERLPALLRSPVPGAPRAAVVAAGLRRLRPASGAILEHLESSGDAADLRALGRIWERRLSDPPLGKADEVERLTTLAVLHRLSMGAEGSPEACEAMLRAMAREELEDFLGKHAGERFPARRLCDQAARKRGFDPEKGARIHEALLASPDAGLVAGILDTSPHALREAIVRGFLSDRRPVREGVLVCDAAAARLSGKRPATRAERDALLESLRR
jgi:hypothetical protein